MALASMKSSMEADIQVRDSKFSEKQIGKQGLRKKILKKGISWQTPFPGDEVEVHLSGHVEGGACLDSTRDKGVPFIFKLGQGEVIKGLDDGAATMKKGERAIFKVPPNLAYEEAGSPPLIPSNAALFFDVEMLSWSSIRDIAGDGGILKRIIKEGEGWATPRDGDKVLVKYEAGLENGLLVSKSEEGEEFHIGDGYLCPAFGKAVKTMRKGEEAELSVKCSYGFSRNVNVPGDTGRSIHPHSSFSIKLELVSWKSVIDITGNKKVLKTIVQAGEGFERPNDGSQVKVAYTGKLEDRTVIEKKGTAEEPFEFITLEDQINEGLDRAIMTMKKGEQALVRVSAEYLSGHEISGMFPANSVLHYEVELIDFIKEKPFWKMGAFEKLEACERKKMDGNALFKAEKFWRASKKYEKATNYIDFDHSFTDDQKCLAKGLRLLCNLNNAACKLKLGEYLEASRLCTKVLEQEPFNIKALFRRSQAYLKTLELEKAEDDINRALTIDPNNRDVKLVYKELKDKQREYVKYQADFFSTMISRMS
ncbi:hypothetical protein P3X46_009120 [Hevea brasiliensis]|uniref:peptidylprolyl isomerase n=1 Tax=Hevea brasiliensis TaxID=3981 RepID=A0ABQ9MPB8_HEVBR|nr:70 kDa peptidyl-prolyl isomerase isoform X2 [Hevea brasiliensis]KAJ9180936.1 hypothetical protein P3X46_009120 [Hevea brasiliensis]